MATVRALRPHRRSRMGENGSYLVIRRLRQDVKAFRDAMSKQAKRLAKEQGFKGVSAATLAAKLVGRWPSGAPAARSPEADNEALGKNDFANNHFAFQDDTTPVPLKNAPPHRPDDFAQSRADLFGFRVPTRLTSGRSTLAIWRLTRAGHTTR